MKHTKRLLTVLMMALLCAVLAMFANAELLENSDCSINGHRPSNWIVPVDADCTLESFTRIIKCLDCGTVLESEVVEKGEHQKELYYPIPATCLKEGFEGGIFCTRCQKCFMGGEIIPVLPHDMVVVEEGFPATCSTNGLTDHTVCSMCQLDQPSEVIPALCHNGGIVEVTKRERTCLEDGYKMDACFCKLCKKVFSPENTVIDEIIDPAPGRHVYFYKEFEAPTYIADGWFEHWECNQTPNQTEYFFRPVLGGSWLTVNDDEAEKYPLNDGYYVYEQVSEDEVIIPRIPHEHSIVLVEEQSYDKTCTSNGLSVTACEICKEVWETVIPSQGHVPGKEETIENTFVNCDIGGSKTTATYCSVCGEEICRKTVEIPVSQHSVQAWIYQNIYMETAYREGMCSVCKQTVREPLDPFVAAGVLQTLDGSVKVAYAAGALPEGTILSAEVLDEQTDPNDESKPAFWLDVMLKKDGVYVRPQGTAVLYLRLPDDFNNKDRAELSEMIGNVFVGKTVWFEDQYICCCMDTIGTYNFGRYIITLKAEAQLQQPDDPAHEELTHEEPTTKLADENNNDPAPNLNFFQHIVEWFRSLFDKLFGWMKK